LLCETVVAKERKNMLQKKRILKEKAR